MVLSAYPTLSVVPQQYFGKVNKALRGHCCMAVMETGEEKWIFPMYLHSLSTDVCVTSSLRFTFGQLVLNVISGPKQRREEKLERQRAKEKCTDSGVWAR